jgi:hypothetical protein
MTTRAEHLAFCKKRAHEYLARGEVVNAVTSMLSDMSKHPETEIACKGALGMLAVSTIMSGSIEDARRYIDGFN